MPYRATGRRRRLSVLVGPLTVNGKQTSSSFNGPQEAAEFQTLAHKTSPAKALEAWAAKGIAPNVHTVASWCLHHT